MERELLGYKVKVRSLLNRDRAFRSRIYNALDGQPGDTWEFAVMACQIVSIDGTDWQPPEPSSTDEEIAASYQMWLDEPIEVGDVINLALMSLRAPANPELLSSDEKKD